MRRCFWGIGCLLSSSIAFAGAMGPIDSTPTYNGFYVGGALGVANLMDTESTPYAPGLYDQHQFASTGFLGGGLLGYLYTFTYQTRLGVEGFINGDALNVAGEQLYGTQPSYQANLRYNGGVRLLPSYLFTPDVMGHILLGYSYGHFNIKDNGNYGFVNTDIDGNGFQAGLGLRMPCYFPNLSLRGDMIYTTYGTNNTLGLSTSLTSQNYQNKFSTLEGTLSLVYQFL